MRQKFSEREKAIQMRKDGTSYREILQEIPVAKSTLSLWLRSVGLSNPQMQRLTQKRLDAIRRGADRKKEIRENESLELINAGIRDIGKLNKRELWLVGATLYWAEGSKQHAHNPSVGVIFSNSDPLMHRFYLQWLKLIKVPIAAIGFELFVHKSRVREINEFKRWWELQIGLPKDAIQTAYLKSGNTLTNRHNKDDLYHGLLRIKVASSTSLNRRIQGWIRGIAGSV